MKPRLNKLILLLLLLGIFAFIVEIEQKVFNYLKVEVSEWAFFDTTVVDTTRNSINPYSNQVSLASMLTTIFTPD